MISTVKSRRLMSMQAKKEKEEMDRQNKGSGQQYKSGAAYLMSESSTFFLFLFRRAHGERS